MSFCTNCGQEVDEGAKFCSNCGKPTKLNEHDNTKRKTVYDGVIHKCPNCGDILDSYEYVCETCGYERRGAEVTSSVFQLQERLQVLYSKRPTRKTRSIFTQVFVNNQLSNIDEEIVNLIKNYSIPNNKEDIIEFIILASSNIDLKVYGINGQQYQIQNPAQREISDAWLAKFEQAYQKAHLTFGSYQEFIKINSIYENKQREIKKKKRQIPLLVFGSIFGSLLLISLPWLFI